MRNVCLNLDVAFNQKVYINILRKLKKNFEFFLCLFDGLALIGTIAIRRMDKDKCELKAFYLLKDYHGKGLGMKLMQDVIDYTKKSGFHLVRQLFF